MAGLSQDHMPETWQRCNQGWWGWLAYAVIWRFMVLEVVFVICALVLRPAECNEDDDDYDTFLDCDVDNDTMEFLSLVDCKERNGPPFICSVDIMLELLTVATLLAEQQTHLENAFGGTTDFNELSDVFPVIRELADIQSKISHIIKSQNVTNSAAQYCYDEEKLEGTIKLLTILSDFGNAYGPWIRYYFPVIYGTEFTVGMLGNIFVLVILLRHKDMRTKPNVIILNLAIGDLLLVVNATAICYFRFRWIFLKIDYGLCLSMVYLNNLATGISVYSMAVLSILRFLAVSSKVAQFLGRQHVKLLVLCVWLVGCLCAMLNTLNTNKSCVEDNKSVIKYVSFVCLCFLPLLIVLGFSWFTMRIIRRSVHSVPGDTDVGTGSQRIARERSAKLIICLMVVYCITYLPLNIYHLTENDNEFNVMGDVHFNLVGQALLPLSSCLNPLALYVGSRNFREHCKEYIRCCRCFKRYDVLQQRTTTSTTVV